VVEKLIFERSRPGTRGALIAPLDVPGKGVDALVPEGLKRSGSPVLPEVSEPVVVRHFTNLSVLNHHVDKDFYPLGSCTMKYNPKINEEVVRLPGIAGCHPLQPDADVQGLVENLERRLAAHESEMERVYYPAAAPLLTAEEWRILSESAPPP